MGTNVRKLLNLIVISGERRHFFRKKKFELYVYFTPMRKVIVDYKTYKIKVKDLKLDFGKGTSIQVLIDWADKNKYHYTLIERHND